MKMSATKPENQVRRKALVPSIPRRGPEGYACSFCDFVLCVYPTLDCMTDLDSTMYREHLKRAHGLRQPMGK